MKKGNKIDPEFFVGIAGGAAASGFVGEQLMNIDMVAANPMYVGGGKALLGIGLFMYGGKSKVVQGAGIGLFGAGMNDLAADFMPVKGLPHLSTNARHRRNTRIMGNRGGYNAPLAQVA